MIAIPLQHIRDRAADNPPDYLARCLASGQVEGENLLLTPESYAALLAEYHLHLESSLANRCQGCAS